MTSTNPTRRPPRRVIGRRGGYGGGRDGRSPVGERLRDARERRGVDLYRAERDTKIRAKFLAAIEEGEFTDLPGDVYTRGFLRNYATYLELDPDEIEEAWRQEAGEIRPLMPTIVGPQPLTVLRRITFERRHLVIALVVLIVVVVGGYFGYQLTRYLSYPTLGVDSPTAATVTVPLGTASYVLTGTATPGTTVLIAWNGQDPKTAIADDSGHWTFTAPLQGGSNQFDVTAENLDTSHASATIRRIVLVPIPTPTPPVPEVLFSAPADGASVANGAVTVTGTSTDVSLVTITPTYLGSPLAPGATLPPPTSSAAATSPAAAVSPGASVGPSPTPGPQPTTTATAADGTFTFSLQLTPGRWQLAIVGTNSKGVHTTPVTRTITVPYKGLNVVIQLKGGSASVSYFHDGVTDDSGTVHPDGWSVTVVGSRYVCINTTRPNLVFVTVNGVSYGPVSGFGGRRVYIDANGVKSVSSC
jgi:cytoskeletal protein RodZ